MSGVFKSREKITGLTEFLSGTTDLSHGLCDTNIENLFVVQSGSVSPNPTALLQSKNFNDMIETLRKYFDYIIVVSLFGHSCLFASPIAVTKIGRITLFE